MPIQSRLLSLITIVGVLCFLTLIVNAQSLEPKPKPNGSISGRITIDGKGAAGIPVAAVEGPSVNRRDAPARAFSDVEGNYQISGLAPSEYQVWTLTPALVAEPAGSPNYFYYAGAAKSILLGAGENVTGVDLKLIRGSVITGRVTTADNKPVVEERVSLQLVDANGNPPRLGGPISSMYDQMFQTDDRGVYRIFDLPPGRYRVSVGYDPANEGMIRGRRYDKTYYLDPTDQSKPAIIELSEGDEVRNVDIKVQPAPKTYSISGRVIDTETGVSIAKAGVRFMPGKDSNGSGGFGIQADERGEFSWGGFSPGRYSVSAGGDYYGGNFYSDPVYFEVVDKDLKEIEVKTVPGLSVDGIIATDGLSSKELLALLPGLTVLVSGAVPGNNQVRTSGRAVVSPDGSFLVEGLRPGPVTVFVSTQRPPFVRTIINRMERDGVPLSQNFDLKESMSGLHIVIDYGTGIIRGTVKFEGSDAPITDSRMYVSCKRAGARDGNTVQVDARGHFVVTNLSPGPWEVTLQINSLTPRPPRGVAPQKQIVNIANGSETEVTFVVPLPPKQGGP